MKVTFLPMLKTVDVRKGKTLLDIAKEHGLPIHFECDGNCTCGTCHVQIEEGGEHLSLMGSEEKLHLERQGFLSTRRLSCQSRVLGDVTITIPEWPKV